MGPLKRRKNIIMILGGGDLASGVALRLYRAGLKLVISELPQPLAVRRYVSFAEAVYQGEFEVEGVVAKRVDQVEDIDAVLASNKIPVIVDPELDLLHILQPLVLVDARMLKHAPEYQMEIAPLVIGLGPGFVAGEHCHAVIETNRGHKLGRVIWKGAAEADTRIPEAVLQRREERVLRAPSSGIFLPDKEIGDRVIKGELIARIDDMPVYAPFDGIIRGLVYHGIYVSEGMKIGDVDPRDDPTYAFLVSDKALSVGGGVLEAILQSEEIRKNLWI